MKRCLQILGGLFFLWLVSCSHDKRIPRGLIGIHGMSDILLDMQMATTYNDSYISHPGHQPTDSRQRIKVFYLQILMLHHTDKETFLKSYHFYEQHPDLMKKVYGLMQDSINRKSAYEDSLSQRADRLLARKYEGHLKMRNFLWLYKSMMDSIHPPPLRIFRPDHFEQERVWPEPVKDFLWIYKSFADSIHSQPFRVFKPDHFDGKYSETP